MATAPDEITFEEASAPAAEAPEEISFEEGHGIDPEAIKRGIELGTGETKRVAGMITSPLLGGMSQEARQFAEAQRQKIRTGIELGVGQTQQLASMIGSPLLAGMSEQSRKFAEHERTLPLFAAPVGEKPAGPPRIMSPEEQEAARRATTMTTVGGAPQRMGQVESPMERQERFTEEGFKPAVELPKFQITKDMGAGEAALKEAANLIVAVPEFMESPFGILSAGAGAISGTAVRLAFALDMAKNLFQQYPDVRDNWDKRTPAENAKAVTDLAGSVAMLGMLGHPELKARVSAPFEARTAPEAAASRLAPTPPVSRAAPAPLVRAPLPPPVSLAAPAPVAPPALPAPAVRPEGPLAPAAARQPVPPGVPTARPAPAPAPAAEPAPAAPAAIKSVEDFSNLLANPSASPRNVHSIAAGLSAKSVADLDTLAALRDKYDAAYKKNLADAKDPNLPVEQRDALFNEALRNTNRAQVSREAIEAATNTGSWVEGEGTLEPVKIGERPLDWSKNKEAANWLAKNGKRLGIDLPEGLTTKTAQKGAHEMTKAEFLENKFVKQALKRYPGKDPLEIHKGWIRKAIAEGRTIPPEVLADYPDLKAEFEKQKPVIPEKITAAAYRTPEGKVETGANHHEILKRLGVTGFETPESRNTPQFGFVTDKGRFVTREEAGPISKASGQALKDFEPGEPVHSDEVASPVQQTLPLSEVPKMTEDQVRDLVSKAAQIVRTRKLTSPERANLAREMENARQGKPEALQKLVESLSRALPKEAPKIKGGPRGKFDAETAEHGEDILSWMADNAKVLSKSGAQKAGRYKGNPGEWADAPSKLSAVHHGVIFSENGSLPSEVAQIAFNEGKIRAPSSTALWEAIAEASRKRKGAVEGAARAAKLAAEEGPQFERWQSATKAPRDTHPIELTTEELKVGDTIKVEGETIRVTAKDPDSGELKLVNGDRFGSQILQEGEKIYVAEHIEKPTTERPGEVFSMTEQHPGGEAGAAILAHGTTSGLPVGVPDGGPHFGSELMAAAQRLGTIIRTRTTLGPGVLGQYSRSKRAGVVYADKIEVGNLQNQSTMAHEMGHDLDQLLWPSIDLAYSMRSLAQRAGITGNGRELHNELMKVSTYMRGEAKGSKAYVEYRKRAAELIADHFALYAHDPALARSLAPKWTKVLEDQLAKNKDAAETIKQLHAGNVTPAIPTAAAAAPVGAAAGMPGRVPPVLPPVALSPDANLFSIAAQAVKGLVRKFKMEVIRAQIIADDWRKLVPQQMQRYDVGAAVEGTGNLEIPGDTIEAVRARMTPEMLTMFKRYKFVIENVRGNVNEFLKGMTEGEYLDFVKDYLPHFYDIDSKQGKIALGRFLKNSPNAKQRKIPTLQEAVTYGLRPITQDPAVLYELHSRINWRVATNRMLIGQLGEMKTASGQPVLVPWSEEPGGYVRSDNPLIQRVYAMKGKGGTMLWRGGAGIHPDAWTAVRQMLEMPTSSTLATAYDTVNSIARANAFAFSFFHDITLRAAAAGAGAIHLGIPRTVGEIPQKINPFRGLVRIFEKNPLTGELEIFRSTKKLGQELMSDEEAATDAARHGLVFSWNDSESYQMAARDFLEKAAVRWKDNPILGPTSSVLRDLQMLRQRQLWKNTHDAYKIIAYHDLTSKALAEAPPGTNPSAVKEQIASMLNDAFGGQEWQTKFWLSPQNRRMLSRAFLAPDWTFSTLRSVPMVSDTASIIRGQAPRIVGREPIPTSKEGWNANMMRYKFWRGELAAIATATLAAQYAIYRAFGNKDKGDKEWVWENEDGQRTRVDITPIMRKLPWKDPNDPTRYYMNLGKRPQEILAYFTQADQILMSKAARPVAEVLRQVTGTEGDFKAQWKRDHETFLESIPQRSLKAAGTFLPFVFGGNQFALSVPYRKGMTKYKAQQAFESTYELAADPGLFPSAKAFLRGVPSPKGTLDEMVASITDAAERNGVPSEEIRKRALSTIRGKYYDKFFKASKKGDDKAMEKAAQALENLGATGAEIFRSVKRRTALEPYAE